MYHVIYWWLVKEGEAEYENINKNINKNIVLNNSFEVNEFRQFNIPKFPKYIKEKLESVLQYRRIKNISTLIKDIVSEWEKQDIENIKLKEYPECNNIRFALDKFEYNAKLKIDKLCNKTSLSRSELMFNIIYWWLQKEGEI